MHRTRRQVLKVEECPENASSKRKLEENDVPKVAKKVKIEKERDDSDTEKIEEVDYVRRREENIRENKEFFKTLGIAAIKEEIKDSVRKKSTASSRGLKREKVVKEVLPRRSSLRLQNMTPTGIELPPKELLPQPLEEHPRPPSGPLQMTEYLFGSSTEEDHQHIQKLVSTLKVSSTKTNKTDLDKYVATLSKVTLTEERVAKVVPNRSFSVALHPSQDKVLAATGDKWGKVGLFDVLSKTGYSDGVCCYSPHARPVNCLEFPTHSPHKLYSCSYDGTLRCMDIDKEIFQEIYTISDEYDILLRNFSFTSPQTMLVSQNDGCVVVVDTRTKSCEAEQEFHLHDRPLRSVSSHPVHTHLLCTGSVDGTVCVWDQRNLKKSKNKPLSSFYHGKSVSSAYFSPLTGGQVLTTSMDNRLIVFTCDSAGTLQKKQSISHNNHTGRWLTGFRASWHPAREDLFVIGSMNRPREVSLFSVGGQKVISLRHEEWLGSVLSLNTIHPTLNVLAGVNSSGRLHVFM